jgi:hypothetical protein
MLEAICPNLLTARLADVFDSKANRYVTNWEVALGPIERVYTPSADGTLHGRVTRQQFERNTAEVGPYVVTVEVLERDVVWWRSNL